MQPPRYIAITGASSGIGRALAEHYATPGAVLYLTGRSLERLESVAAVCRAKGAVAEIAALEITDAAAVAAWVEAADARTSLDLLIANAGISGGSGGHTPHCEEPAQVRRLMAVNLDGVINSVAPVIPRMASRRQGQIAVMSSLAGFRGLPSAPAYSTSKGAVRLYGEALRGWLGKYGVRVSVICPGYVRTPLTSHNPFPMPFLLEPEKAARIIARNLQRNKGRIVFPWQLWWPMWIASNLLPPAVTDPIFSRLPAKPAVEGML